MAAYRSLALAFLLAAVPGTLAVDSRSTTTDGLQKACNATSSPRICLKVLTRAGPDPESPSTAASPRRLAELAFRYLEKRGPALLAEARRETAATRNRSMRYCLREFNDDIRVYARWLHGLAPERGGGDAEFVEAKRRLEALLEAPSNSGISCWGGQVDEKPVIRRIFDYEAMMQVTLCRI
ncbi:unnamed protein product [Miscanthus lutarioriparius]|uniref:Pectinesterase inhibitor domain-containing protein n=1 Tax=Miscanthus lutarioriparius TaxID=422564 RepID=A0A811NE75_9POAL|nr:unnamed protein product [Miscanthus lutarioriparius]